MYYIFKLQTYLVDDKGRKIGIGHIPVVGGVLFTTKSEGLCFMLVKTARILFHWYALFE